MNQIERIINELKKVDKNLKEWEQNEFNKDFPNINTLKDARNNDKLKPFEKIPCTYCNKYKTFEGHDGCLGELIGITNACCGHGNNNTAYIQFFDGTIVQGEDAILIQNILKKHSVNCNNKDKLLFLKNSVKFYSKIWY